MRIATIVLGGLLLAGLARPVSAQISYGGGRSAGQSVGVSVSSVRFSFTGSEVPSANFNFDHPVYGLVLSRPGILVGAGRGRQAQSDGDALTLTDFHLTAWGALRPFEREGIQPTVPIGLQSSYRRVSRSRDTGSFDAFEFTVLALGAGVGFERQGQTSLVSGRVMPMFGIASRAIGTDTGTSALLDADLDATFGPWGGRFGLSVGYGFRWQRWNLNTSRFLPDAADDTFDYTGSMHTIRLGLLF